MHTNSPPPVPPAERLGAGCAPSKLSIPNDPFYVRPACRYAAEIAKQIGFDDRQIHSISAGLQRALTTLLRYSFEPKETASVDLVSERIPAGLRISLRDQGLPLSASDTGSGDAGADNPLYGLNEYFDEVRFHNRGREGKEIVLSKHLPDPSVAEYAAACALDSLEAPDVGRPAVRTEAHCTARPLKPSEAYEVSKAVYKAYGYSYAHDFVYYPEKIAELNRSGEIFSVVAVAENNEIAGHCSMQLWEENPRIAEMVQGVVKPPFRSQGCFANMTDYLIETARARGLDGIFSEAVTSHPFSQKTALQFGLRDCALLLGPIPATADFKGLGGVVAERGSLLVQFRYLTPAPSTPVYAPALHRTMIAAIFRNLGTAPHMPPEHFQGNGPTAADSGIAVKLSRSLNLARIRIDRYGRNVIDLLRRQVKALCLQKWDVIHLLLDLSNPATAHFGKRFEELGFFFAGVLPRGLPSGDALILQYLNNLTVSYESIQAESEFAAELAAYVRQCHPVLP